jgi:hypothetical protein
MSSPIVYGAVRRDPHSALPGLVIQDIFDNTKIGTYKPAASPR